MTTPTVFDKTVALMRDRLSLNSQNQKVISGNLANLNTPGYKAKELSFDSVLRQSLEDHVLQMVRTSDKHSTPDDPVSAMQNPETIETGPVDLDHEMVRLSRNSVEYQYIVTMLNKRFSMLLQAINEGGQ